MCWKQSTDLQKRVAVVARYFTIRKTSNRHPGGTPVGKSGSEPRSPCFRTSPHISKPCLFTGRYPRGQCQTPLNILRKSLIKIEPPKEMNQCKTEHRKTESKVMRGPRLSPRFDLLLKWGLVECAPFLWGRSIKAASVSGSFFLSFRLRPFPSALGPLYVAEPWLWDASLPLGLEFDGSLNQSLSPILWKSFFQRLSSKLFVF